LDACDITADAALDWREGRTPISPNFYKEETASPKFGEAAACRAMGMAKTLRHAGALLPHFSLSRSVELSKLPNQACNSYNCSTCWNSTTLLPRCCLLLPASTNKRRSGSPAQHQAHHRRPCEASRCSPRHPHARPLGK
jgi:hypothetical protein